MNDIIAPAPAKDLVTIPAADPAEVHLIKYEAAKQAVIEALNETTDLEEACGIRNQAIVIKKLAQLKEDRALIDTATEIRLRAQRRIGQLLKEMAERGERDPGRGGDRKSRSHDATLKPKTLDDLGLNKSDSSRCQRVAELSKEDFEARVAETKARAAGVKVKFERPETAPDRVRQFINLVDRCWEIVEDLERYRDDIPHDVRIVALGHLESYKRKLQAEAEQRKAEQKAAARTAAKVRKARPEKKPHKPKSEVLAADLAPISRVEHPGDSKDGLSLEPAEQSVEQSVTRREQNIEEVD
jgi:hypothetical protein